MSRRRPTNEREQPGVSEAIGVDPWAVWIRGSSARVWRAEAETFADEVTYDVLGNSYARLSAPGAPVVVIEGHIDEIGLLITHVDAEGFLWFDGIGGWDDQVLVGQRIRIAGNHGDVYGVIGRKARHILSAEDREKAVKTNELWIDIGASNRAAALERVTVGDPAVIDAEFLHLTDDLCVARSMDNRVGGRRARSPATARDRSTEPRSVRAGGNAGRGVVCGFTDIEL